MRGRYWEGRYDPDRAGCRLEAHRWKLWGKGWREGPDKWIEVTTEG